MASSRILSHALNVQRRHLLPSNVATAPLSCYFNVINDVKQKASYCTKKTVTRVESDYSENKVTTSFQEKVKEGTKTVSYLGIILCGAGVTAWILYAVFKELFSSKSPSGVYSKAVERCLQEPRLVDALGSPVKAFGEETRRGRRTHVSHKFFEKDGVEHLRMQFYLQGTRRRGTVYLEVKENESGDYDYRYLYVVISGLQNMLIKIEDNTDKDKIPDTPQSMLDIN